MIHGGLIFFLTVKVGMHNDVCSVCKFAPNTVARDNRAHRDNVYYTLGLQMQSVFPFQ